MLKSLSNLPDSSEPSHFVLAAEKDLADACRSASQQHSNVTVHSSSACISGTYQLELMTNSLSNWYRALCLDENDPSWSGNYVGFEPSAAGGNDSHRKISGLELNGAETCL